MTGKQMVKYLQKYGFVIDRIKGSHHIMKKASRVVPIPVHGNKELSKGLACISHKMFEIQVASGQWLVARKENLVTNH